MPAYVRQTASEFVDTDVSAILGSLQQAYAADGFASQYTRQTKAWATVVPGLQRSIVRLLTARPETREWSILLEYPLDRLRRRIDVVILAGSVIVVVECKVGAEIFSAEDRRQVEEYALDLRDFHAASHGRRILPVLWSTAAAPHGSSVLQPGSWSSDCFAPLLCVGSEGLHGYLIDIDLPSREPDIGAEAWDRSAYRPVPNIIEAATSVFAGHDVRSIANADAANLQSTAARLIHLIEEARQQHRRYLLLLTGVPGSGKTLVGLHVVHRSVATGVEDTGDIVYLSGNTPLVVVLREALARDEHRRHRGAPAAKLKTLKDIRRDVRARIQHINDFLQESLRGSSHVPPHEHVIVFDEAQRAWDEKQGLEKFERTASEPALLLELMGRHDDWCACVCLLGGGQEINSGEEGVFGWGQALRTMPSERLARWNVIAPPDVLHGGASVGTFTVGELPDGLNVRVDPELQLLVPQRCYRSPQLSRWVDCVIAGDVEGARATALELGKYPIVVTRSLSEAKEWLRTNGRGERRYGLVASSGARRLRAEGLGVTLDASAGAEIAHWYLNRMGDIRSSYALEVPANEYTCQGLELDFACVCWGGDLLWNQSSSTWTYSRLSGTAWHRVQDPAGQQYLSNSYRVLMTRAREGMVLWVPHGEASDATRPTESLNATAEVLVRCGAAPIGD